MSKAVSALDGVVYKGAVTVAESGLQGMISLRADLATKAVAAAIKEVTGAAMPGVRRIEHGADGAVAWMSPDELMVLCAHDTADAVAADLSAHLGAQHHLAVNVSDARAMFELSGSLGAIRDTLAKITPADMDAGVLALGEMRRTRLAQVPAAIWFEENDRARVICFRSVAQYTYDLLCLSARGGGEVGYHQ